MIAVNTYTYTYITYKFFQLNLPSKLLQNNFYNRFVSNYKSNEAKNTHNHFNVLILIPLKVFRWLKDSILAFCKVIPYIFVLICVQRSEENDLRRIKKKPNKTIFLYTKSCSNNHRIFYYNLYQCIKFLYWFRFALEKVSSKMFNVFKKYF